MGEAEEWPGYNFTDSAEIWTPLNIFYVVPEVPTKPIAEIKPGPPTPVQQPSVTTPIDSPPKGARSEHRVWQSE